MRATIVFIPLMIQKPSRNSKTKDHKYHLNKRLQMWERGQIKDLINEGKMIQKRFQTSQRKTKSNITKAFANLILQGKTAAACKLINREQGGPVMVNDEVMAKLKDKHPKAKSASSQAILPNLAPRVIEPILYEGIDAQMVHKSAMNTKGSGGPSKVDAEIWRQMLCSKSFQPASMDLCEQISILAKRLCRDFVNPDYLVEFTAGRLIPLNKDPQSSESLKIRPIGVGEVIRRLVGKSVMTHLRPEIIDAAGPLQTCAGMPGDVEAAIHGMREIFNEEDTEVFCKYI